MSKAVRYELEAALMALPGHERARLAERLIASLDDDPEIEAAWAEEVKRRLDALDRGEMGTVPAEDALAEARRRITRL